MHGWGTRFLAIAAAEAIVGWTGVAGAATTISWLLCVLFLSVALLSGPAVKIVSEFFQDPSDTGFISLESMTPHDLAQEDNRDASEAAGRVLALYYDEDW